MPQVSHVMEKGDLVKVTYVMPSGNGQWYRWEMTAVYLGARGSGRRRECDFSLRPLAGSTQLADEWIERTELVLSSADLRAKYRDGARDAALPVRRPKRFKGAVKRG